MFELGRRYRRRDLHRHYGGQWQGGISTPSAHPFVLLFTGATGEQYGYRDGWEPDGTFRNNGEGQVGDMAFVRGSGIGRLPVIHRTGGVGRRRAASMANMAWASML